MESKLDELLASFKDLKETQDANQKEMSEKLEKLEKDVHAGQDTAAERAVKKLKRDRGLEFKKKGHERQFLFNDEVKDKMENATAAMQKVDPSTKTSREALDEAKKELEEGIQLIAQRQKLIRLADRSEYGWDAVNEYEKDQLAEDDDDAKRLEKAEKAAEQKAFKKRRAAAHGGGRGRSRRPNALPVAQKISPPSIGAVLPPVMAQRLQPRGSAYRPPKIPGPCFHCLKMGHLKANCPELAKPYPFVVSSGGNVYISSNCAGSSSQCGITSSGNDKVIELTKGLPKGVTLGVPVSDEDCVNSNVCTISNSGKGTAQGVNVRPPMANQQDLSDDAITAVVPDVKLDGIAGKTHPDKVGSTKLLMNEAQTSPLLEMSSVEMPEGDEYLDEQFCESRIWEVEEGPTQIQDVQGRLKTSFNFWRDILKATQPVLDWINEGYKLPLLSVPPPRYQPNQKSALTDHEFVSAAIKELLMNHCAHKVSVRLPICNPLSVVTNADRKKRLVVNLRYLNQYLLKEKFKYEEMRITLLMFQSGDFMCSFDLKSGYHHIDIHSEHWQYLGFSWALNASVEYYVFCVLPFGLATACYVFTKVMRPLVKNWRQQGIRVIVYLDNVLVASEGIDSTQEASRIIRRDLARAGWVENIAKCRWEPAQQRAWLGFDIDLQQGTISVPQGKLENLHAQLESAKDCEGLHAKSLASLIGKLISMSLAIGPVTRLMTRSMYSLLNLREAWCDFLPVTAEVRKEMEFWCIEIARFNGQNIWPSPSAIRVVYTDASDTGYAGYTVEHGCHVAHGQWLPHEATQSSHGESLKR